MDFSDLRRVFAAALFALPLCAQVSSDSAITRFPIANWVFPANGASGINAPIFTVSSLTTDPNGHIVFADQGNHVVLRVNSDGTVTVLAGNGLGGFSGDGGPATAASLNRPSDAAMDEAGNLYIYDEFNERIRLVTPDGIITTIAGNGISRETGNGGPAKLASIGQGDRIAVDGSGNLYIAAACQIRRITPDGMIAAFAGTGNCNHGADGPALKTDIYPDSGGMAFDSSGNLYFAEELILGYIRKISAADGTITTIAGSGVAGFSAASAPGLQTSLNLPKSVAVDSAGNVFFAEVNNEVVRQLSTDGTVSIIAGLGPSIAGFAGDQGPAKQAALSFPSGVAFDGQGNLNIADTGNFRVRRIKGTVIDTIVGNGQFRAVPNGTPSAQAFLYGPNNITFDASGNMLISEVSFRKVARINAADSSMQILAGTGVMGYGAGAGGVRLIGYPRQIATDAQGSVYFADNYATLIYKITSDGTMSVVAGTLYKTTPAGGNNGDNGPALSATFRYPYGVAADPSGVIYVADVNSNVVRRIGTDGTIPTYAGTGTAGFSGDGGPANAAQLSAPYEIALDGIGNLLICDRNNNRIRQVAPDGTITTVAGTGSPKTSGDGGPATSAGITSPFSIALDHMGGFYILTNAGGLLRYVDANGNISTIAGNGTLLNVGDGGPAGQAQIESDGVAVDSFGNVFMSSFGSDSVRVILNFEPDLNLTNQSFSEFPDSNVSLTLVSGGAKSAPQSYSVAGDFTGILFNATADQPWIALANTQGSTPATLTYAVDPSALAPGLYKGTISLSRAGGTGTFAIIAITLNVVASLPPKLGAQPKALSLSAAIDETTSQSQTLQVFNSGSGTLKYQIFADGSVYMSLRAPIALQKGTVSAGTPVNIPLSVNPSNLAPGTYSATISVQSSTTNETINVPLSINVATKAQRMSLSQRGLTFTGVQGGGVTPPQSFAVVNAGGGSFDWTAKPVVVSGSSTWLSITPQAGTSTAGAPAPSVTVAVDPKMVPGPGVYYGIVRVSSSNAANAPQDVEVVLNYLGAANGPGALVSRSGLIFVAPAGASSPSSQSITVTNLNASSLGVSPSASTYEGIPWLTVSSDKPGQIISPGGSLTLSIAATIDNLSLGVHVGTVLLQFPPPLRNIEVAVRLIITGSGSSSVSSNGTRDSTGCAATTLVPVLSSLVDNFSLPAAWPVSLEATVYDDCGVPFSNGQVVVSFSNGDPPLSLTPLDNGLWDGTWFGGNSRAALELSLDASAPPLDGVQTYHGLLQPNDSVPAITPGGATGAVGQTAVGAGSIVSIVGTSFAATSAAATTLPLNTTLAGNTVYLGGINLPLIYTSANKINVVVPYDMQPGQYDILVTRGGQISDPEPMVVGPAQPAIFEITTSTDPRIAQNVWSAIAAGKSIDPSSVAPANPVTAGTTLMIYCTGLGAVGPYQDPSQAAPSPGPAVQNPVTLTIGGVSVPVSSATLVPGYTGIYVVQATLPNGIPAGAARALVVSTLGQSSPAVNVSVN